VQDVWTKEWGEGRLFDPFRPATPTLRRISGGGEAASRVEKGLHGAHDRRVAGGGGASHGVLHARYPVISSRPGGGEAPAVRVSQSANRPARQEPVRLPPDWQPASRETWPFQPTSPPQHRSGVFGHLQLTVTALRARGCRQRSIARRRIQIPCRRTDNQTSVLAAKLSPRRQSVVRVPV
jgi:hypothetical protein